MGNLVDSDRREVLTTRAQRAPPRGNKDGRPLRVVFLGYPEGRGREERLRCSTRLSGQQKVEPSLLSLFYTQAARHRPQYRRCDCSTICCFRCY